MCCSANDSAYWLYIPCLCPHVDMTIRIMIAKAGSWKGQGCACAGELVTKANGDASDRVGRPVDDGQIGIIDPSQRMIGLHMYEGLFKVS